MTVDWNALPDLASRLHGGSVVAANDEFFAQRENLIKPAPPEYRPHTFTSKGQEYDGWETRRRRREPGDHDWAIIRLGIPGRVHTIIVDTTFFKGNYPPFCAIDGCATSGYQPPTDLTAWEPLITRSELTGDTENVFTVDSAHRHTHLRLRIFPDGGVARLRAHGTPVPDPQWLADVPFDLAALANGGTAIRYSDGFFSPPTNMLRPGESRFMSDGWETARRRDNGHDWAIIKLAAHAIPHVLEIDTTHYKGNAPDQISIAGIDTTATADLDDDAAWHPVLPVTDLQPDTPHRFRATVDKPVTHLRLEVFPDGGIGRFRAYGRLTAEGMNRLTAAWQAAQPT